MEERTLAGEGSTCLDESLEAFGAQLRQAAEVVLRLHQGLDRGRITPRADQTEIAALFAEPLPEEPQPVATVLEEVEERILARSVFSLTPRFFGYVNGSGNQVAVLGELLAAAANQICAKWQFSPAASEVERRVVRWIAELIGCPVEEGGCLLSGGSAGNLAGLAVARTERAGCEVSELGVAAGPPLVAYVSEEGHASLDKAMALLGMGRRQLRRIAVGDDFRIDLAALAARIAADRRAGLRPFCVIGNAGTTNTGAIDPLDALADLCHAEGLWFHVDAAYGGPAAGTALAAPLFRGLERADSVVVNPHKWLFVPVEAACLLVRSPEALRRTFAISADYFGVQSADPEAERIDFKDYGAQLSRGFRALKVWMTFKAYGARRLRAAVESNIRVMRYLAERIDEADDFVRLAPVPLSVVCFQYRPRGLSEPSARDRLNARLAEAVEHDGRFFLSVTRLRGRTALRACSVNHRLREQDVIDLLEVLRELGRSLA